MTTLPPNLIPTLFELFMRYVPYVIVGLLISIAIYLYLRPKDSKKSKKPKKSKYPDFEQDLRLFD